VPLLFPSPHFIRFHGHTCAKERSCVKKKIFHLVPQAHLLADVAAVDSVADPPAQLDWDAGLALNGEVADALARVHPVVFVQGARRAEGLALKGARE
jgi:hypothetical protein